MGETSGLNGYKCGTCGQWAYGVHYCVAPSPAYYGQPMFGYIDQSILERIATALEKILVILEEGR
jgi:hypothetical protein